MWLLAGSLHSLELLMTGSWLPPESVMRERKEDRGAEREKEGKTSKTEAAVSFMTESQKWHTPRFCHIPQLTPNNPGTEEEDTAQRVNTRR